jgi:hypothetical protein
MRLHLPVVLAVAVVSVAAVACKEEAEHYFCFPVEPGADAGTADAAACNVSVTHPDDCPPGCEAEPLG